MIIVKLGHKDVAKMVQTAIIKVENVNDLVDKCIY